MSNTALATDKTAKIISAARAEATRLCDRVIPLCVEQHATPEHWARARRYQNELFTCDEWSTHEELIAATDVYCDAGIVEVTRRFALAVVEAQQ